MAFNFGSFAPQGNSTQTPMQRDPWGMLTNVGMGMLANSQYNPGTALGKGYEAAMQQQNEAAKTGAFLDEADRKKRADQQQIAFAKQLQEGLAAAQQPIPQAGAAVAPPPPPIAAPSLGVGDTGPQMGAPNAAGANAAMTGAVNQMSGAIPAPPTQPGPSGGTMPVPAAPPAGMMPGGGEGMTNIMGLQVPQQNVAVAKIWLAQGNTDKAIESLTAGDPNMTETLKNYHAYVQDEVKAKRTPMGLLQYQQALRAKTEVNVGGTTILPGEDEAHKEAGKVIGKEVFGAAIKQGQVAQQNKAMLDRYMQLQSSVKDEGQWNAMKHQFGPLAQMFGANIEGLGRLQAMEAITSKMAPQMRPEGSGSTSNYDMQTYMKAGPQLSNTKEGNAVIASTNQALADSQIKAADIASRWQSGELTQKEALKQMRELDPLKEFKAYAKKNNLDLEGGVKGGGETTPRDTNKPYFDLKTRKLIRPGTTSSNQGNERFGAYGTSGGIRG